MLPHDKKGILCSQTFVSPKYEAISRNKLAKRKSKFEIPCLVYFFAYLSPLFEALMAYAILAWLTRFCRVIYDRISPTFFASGTPNPFRRSRLRITHLNTNFPTSSVHPVDVASQIKTPSSSIFIIKI